MTSISNFLYSKISLLGVAVISIGLWGIGFAWDNDNFIDDSFWIEYDGLSTQGEKDALLIDALYGDGNGGSDTTAYTEKWGANGCTATTGAMSIQVIASGSSLSNLGEYAEANTIYVLEDGVHINSTRTELYGRECISIIGRGDARLYSSIQIPENRPLLGSIYSASDYVIFSNFTLHGVDDGAGGTHAKNEEGIELRYSSHTTYHNLLLEDAGIEYINGGSHIYMKDVRVNNGDTYFYQPDYVTIDGYHSNNSQLWLSYTDYSTLNDINLSGGGGAGLYMSRVNYSTGIDIVSSNRGGSNHCISIQDSSYNYFGDIEVFNCYKGFHISSNAENNVVDKILAYNNTADGISILGSPHNSINNAQIFNNGSHGVYFSDTLVGGVLLGNIIHNSQIYNNGMGVYFGDSDNNILHDVQIYNNTVGIGEHSGYPNNDNLYYGEIKVFGNTTDIAATLNLSTNFIAGTDGLLGWSNGQITQPAEAISYHYVVVPKNGNGEDLYDKYADPSTWVGYIAGWSPAWTVQYGLGVYVFKNAQPVTFNGDDTISVITQILDDRETIQEILECFQTFNISYSDDKSLCLGIQEVNLRNYIKQGITRTQLQNDGIINFDFTFKNISQSEKTVNKIRTRLGTFSVNETLSSEAIGQVEDINAVVLKKGAFEQIAKDPGM